MTVDATSVDEAPVGNSVEMMVEVVLVLDVEVVMTDAVKSDVTMPADVDVISVDAASVVKSVTEPVELMLGINVNVVLKVDVVVTIVVASDVKMPVEIGVDDEILELVCVGIDDISVDGASVVISVERIVEMVLVFGVDGVVKVEVLVRNVVSPDVKMTDVADVDDDALSVPVELVWVIIVGISGDEASVGNCVELTVGMEMKMGAVVTNVVSSVVKLADVEGDNDDAVLVLVELV